MGNTGNSCVRSWERISKQIVIKRINHIFKVNRISTTPYNPRSNGFVENHNGTLKDQLFHFVESRQKDWDIFLPTVQLMYNTTVNVATQFTPYYLMFGRECNMPAIGEMMNRAGEVLLPDEDAVAVGRRELTVQEEWMEALIQSLSRAWQETTVRAHENSCRGNRAGRPNGVKFVEYEVGDSSTERGIVCGRSNRPRNKKHIRST